MYQQVDLERLRVQVPLVAWGHRVLREKAERRQVKIRKDADRVVHSQMRGDLLRETRRCDYGQLDVA